MKKGNLINSLYPWCLGFLLFVLSFTKGVSPKMAGYQSILESIIQFSGLVIGFYTAMYGLVLVSGNSNLFKKFRSEGVDKIFKNNLIYSLSFSFLAYVSSVIMQELQFHSNTMLTVHKLSIAWNEFGFKVWIIIVGIFLGMSYRTIRLLLKMLFLQLETNEKIRKTTQNETSEEKKERLNKLKNRS